MEVDTMKLRHLRLGLLSSLVLALGWAATAMADSPPAHDSPPHEGGGVVISDFAESAKSLAVDAVSPHGPSRDGQVDGIFDVTVTGDLTELMLLSVDANGRPTGSQWDTIRVPASIGAPGNSPSWVLGLEEHGQLRNLTDGRIPLLSGSHHFKLYASNNGWFKVGVSFRLYAVAANGDVVSSPIVAYKSE
jgi:hypothetical protein